MVTARLPQDDIDRAVEALREGEVIAFPTETVYGLGGDAQNPDAIRRIYELKGRPATHPLIVHVDHPRLLERWALAVPPAARALADRFWPGPLTLVLRRAPAVDLAITGGQDTVAVRVPGHPVAQQLLRAFGSGIAAPSANRYGHLSPTRAEHVREEDRMTTTPIISIKVKPGDKSFFIEFVFPRMIPGAPFLYGKLLTREMIS